MSDREWMARRGHGFGASDIPALMLALGGCTEPAPRYLASRAATLSRGAGKGLPRIIAEKAGLAAPLAAGAAASKGTARERELLAHWRTLLEHEQYHDECAEAAVLPASITHADTLLRSCWPLADRRCPRLLATLDAWARDAMGCELVVELKCSATERPALPWYWRAQIIAQLAVSGADYGLLVCGEMWSAWHGNDGPVRVWLVERDEAEIAALRALVERGWQSVEEARESVQAKSDLVYSRMADNVGFDPEEGTEDGTQ